MVEYKNIITITLDYKFPKGKSLPIDSFYEDTLKETRFYLKLFSDKKPLKINPKTAGYSGFLNFVVDTDILIIPFTKSTAYPMYHSKVSFPAYIFNSLKTGEHNIEGELFINNFYGTHYDKETKETTDLEIDDNSIKGSIKFNFKVPEIYLTTIYEKEIVLRNDSAFSPLGMDFSFREGYPDIYWKIYFPNIGDNDNHNIYWRSYEATNAVCYNNLDTVYLYHFSDNDEINIGIYDRDDLSRDDFLGYWEGHVKDLFSDNYKQLSFDNIKLFQIKAKKQGCVNK